MSELTIKDIESSVDRNILVYDDDAPSGALSLKLIHLMYKIYETDKFGNHKYYL